MISEATTKNNFYSFFWILSLIPLKQKKAATNRKKCLNIEALENQVKMLHSKAAEQEKHKSGLNGGRRAV